MTGKAGAAIEDPAVLNRHLHEPISIRVTVTRVGAGRPRYVLTMLPAFANSGEPTAGPA